jgi:glutathione S-transferase
MIVLRTTLTSPFGRKARIAADVLGLTDEIEIVPADTLDPSDSLRTQNPLGKMPTLLLENGMALYDSGVIIEFLQEHAGSELLLPRAGIERYKALTLARLADGIAEAALLMVYESRFREPAQASEKWLDHQRGKLLRGLAAFEATPPEPELDIVAIGLVCALGYLDWRKPVSWRDTHPRLVAWLGDMSDHYPIINASMAPETI